MIRIMAPDLPSPSGGIKVIYNYVEHLVQLGHDARVWHGTQGFGYDGWGSGAPVDVGRHLEFGVGDLLVIPETGGSKWSFLAGDNPVVVLCQGVDFVFSGSDFLRDEPGDYPGWPRAVATIAVSEAIATFLERACTPGFPVHRVPIEIEEGFRPLTKERRVALMPRRRRADLIGAVQLMRRSGRMDGWDFVLIDGMTQAQVAEELGRAAIFLFGAEREGFGLPGAEAMAAGCYVVGFTGDGAKEYMLPDCCSVVPDSDVVGMAEMALAAMAEFDHDRGSLQRRVDIGRERVLARHSADRVRERLNEVFGQLTAPGSPAVLPRPVRLPHYMAHGPRGGRWGAAYRGARRTARTLVDRVSPRA